MVRKYKFTTTAMAAVLEGTPISYADLADIENDFEDAETEIIKTQAKLMAPLYAKRQKSISQIPNFWPLVLEQAPPDIDQYIQPSDSALLLSSLTSISVSRFEIESAIKGKDTAEGDPRSVAIRFEFSGNEYFEDKVMEKKFWYRKARDGWAGLVSEPVPIKWKEGKDLTEGLLDLVVKAWKEEMKTSQQNCDHSRKRLNQSEVQKTLKKKIESTGMGGLSFFAWFGFIGRRVSAEESKEVELKREESKQARKAAKNEEGADADTDSDAGDNEEGDDDSTMELEIFPDGDELAIAISEDLWPSAIKYFTQAQEQDALSEADFESEVDDEDEVPELVEVTKCEGEDSDADGRPAKKRKA